MTFDIPRDVMLQVDVVDVRLDPGQHPFEQEHLAAIDDNWQREKAARPAMFDGTVVLLSELVYADRRLSGRCHAIRFATFLLWRRMKPVADAEHAYAHAMLSTSDGALVAIRMGTHTANPGRVYFAAGSFEPSDFVDGLVDMEGNMEREVREETGLDIAPRRGEDGYFALSMNNGTAIVRHYRLQETADEIARKIRDFVASDPDPEIEGPVIIRNADDLPEGILPHMVPLVKWYFTRA